MYPLDVLSASAICGAGSLVSAALVRPSIGNDEAAAEALRTFRCALAAIGIGLGHVVALDGPPPLWSQAAISIGAVAGVSMVGWSLAALGAERRPPWTMWLMVAIVVAAMIAAVPLGTRGMTHFFALGLAAASTLATWMGSRVVLRPRDLHERLLGVTTLAMLISSWLRASFLLTWQGPFEPHLLYVPPVMVVPFALMYGVLPVLFTMLLVNVIGARLAARLQLRASTDPLTGTLSRYALADGASMLIDRLRRGNDRLAVIMVDLDHFKQINDRHGHAVGDAVLRHGAALLQQQLRTDALLARYGGEEFVALVPVEDLPAARRVAERMRRALESATWTDLPPGPGGVTASLGVAELARDESLEHALARADEALYRAKSNGRNQVQVALIAA